MRLPREKLAEVLLVHLKSYEGVAGNSVYQNGKISKHNFFNSLTNTVGLQKLEYGDQQANVVRALREAWAWLENSSLLIDEGQQWFFISEKGEELLIRNARYERWEKLGVDRVKADLTETGGIRHIGAGPGVVEMAWDWVRMKENKTPLEVAAAGEWTLIADSRLTELRGLASPDFDQKAHPLV